MPVGLSKSPGVEAQPLDDWSGAYVFKPDPASVHLVDLHSWLVLELCDGRSEAEITQAHSRAVDGAIAPRRAFHNALVALVDRGLVRRSEKTVSVEVEDGRSPIKKEEE